MMTVWVVAVITVFFFLPSLSIGQDKDPIKIGIVSCFSGPFSNIGKDNVEGINLYLDKIGNTISGRKIELVTEDDEGAPATALNKVKKLTEMNKVSIIVGPLAAHCCYAVAPYLDSQKMPNISWGPGDDQTQRKRPEWMVRVASASSQYSHPFGEYAYKNLGFRKIAVLTMDFPFSWEFVGGFQTVFEELGGKIVQKTWCPLNVQDFSPYLPLISKDADALLGFFAGKLSIVFMKQFEEYGFKGKIPVIGSGIATDESFLQEMGDTALGLITVQLYSPGLDTPVNKEFVSKYRVKYGKTPSYYSEGGYTAMHLVDQALISLKGDTRNPEKIIKALRAAELKGAPRGPMKFDSYGNPVQNYYIRKVERVNNQLQNTIIYTYPSVSQFWKYKPEEFLKKPVYSRDYPPLKP